MARVVLLDIDGVLTVSWQPLPGAADALRWLRGEGVPLRLITNTSSKARGQMIELLARAGLEIAPNELLTCVDAARSYLLAHAPEAPVYVVNEGDLAGELAPLAVVGVDRAEAAGAVLLGGAGPSTGWPELNAAFRLALDGAPLIALHRNGRFQTADGPALDMGAFVAGLESAAGVSAVVTGKPAPQLFRAALADLGAQPADAVMVGDDIDADARGAMAAGIAGALVRTGKFRPADLQTPGAAPDYVIDGIGDLPALLARLG
jgi:HAD superfamily hydrolase (TIGR01458 family)